MPMNKLKKFAMKVFRFYNSFWESTQLGENNLNASILIQVIVHNLSEEEMIDLKEMLKNMDTDNSGTITFEELKSGFAKSGSKLSKMEVRQLIDVVST